MRVSKQGILLVSSLQLASFAGISTLGLRAAKADELDAKMQMVRERPDDAKAYEDYATAAIRAGKLDDAITQLKMGVARLDEFPRGYYLLGYAFRKKEHWVDAADSYRVYIAMRPTETDAYFGLGKALTGLGYYKGAVTAFKKYASLEKRPQAQKFVDEANADVARLSPASPAAGGGSDPASLRAAADAYKKEGKWPDAVEAYKRAITADPGNKDLYNDLGLALFQQQKFDDAAQSFRSATSRDPNFGVGWYNLARALRKADRKGEAVDAYKRYMKLEPNDPDPYFGLGQTLRSLGDNPGAAAAFRRYIELEKRPEQQKWVEKARAELTTLEPSAAQPKSAIDEK